MHIIYPINKFETPRLKIAARAIQHVPFLGAIFYRLPARLRQSLVTEAVSINERIVEHPWVIMNMGLMAGRVLDVGCCFSTLSLELASLGFETWGIDTQRYPFTHPNFRFVPGDICRSSLPNAYFDRVLAISTIEHIGLGHYGDPTGQSKDQHAMNEIHRLLKMRGKVILSVPFGKKRVTKSFRVYNMDDVRLFIRRFQPEKMDFFLSENGNWRLSTEKEVGALELDEFGRPQAIVIVRAVKTPC